MKGTARTLTYCCFCLKLPKYSSVKLSTLSPATHCIHSNLFHTRWLYIFYTTKQRHINPSSKQKETRFPSLPVYFHVNATSSAFLAIIIIDIASRRSTWYVIKDLALHWWEQNGRRSWKRFYFFGQSNINDEFSQQFHNWLINWLTIIRHENKWSAQDLLIRQPHHGQQRRSAFCIPG